MAEEFKDVEITRRGTLVGTLNYMAPEMLDEWHATLSTDLWALGCIIFKMASGRVPFPGIDQFRVFPKIRARDIEMPKDPLDPELWDLIDKLLQIDGTQRLGAKDSAQPMEALKKHPFFATIDWYGDMTQLGIKELLEQTMPPELKQGRSSLLPENKYNTVPDGQPILTGFLIKKNRYFMKQERRFELYANGDLKYYHDNKVKGELKIVKGSKARKINRTEVEVAIPGIEKVYVLLGKEPAKCPPKTDNFSCFLDDWVEAINYVSKI